MAEYLGFKQFGRDRRAIDRYQPAATPGGGVNGARHQLLSGAGLAEDKDARRRLGNNFNQSFQFFGRRGLANDDFVYRAV